MKSSPPGHCIGNMSDLIYVFPQSSSELLWHLFTVAVFIHPKDKMGIKQLKSSYFGVFLL